MAGYDDWEGRVTAQRRAPLSGSGLPIPMHQLTLAEFAQHPDTHWHGSPAGSMGEGVIHFGTQKAAYEAMRATLIGMHPSGLSWQPGDPLRKLDAEIVRLNAGGMRANARPAWMRDPKLFPVRLHPDHVQDMRDIRSEFPHEDIGDMQDSSDEAANNRIKAGGSEGFFYTNMSEDAGSISGVVPNRAWLQTHEQVIEHALAAGLDVPDHVLGEYPHLSGRPSLNSVKRASTATQFDQGQSHEL